MTLQQALEISKVLAKHDPFVRMTPAEQELANQAGILLSKAANTEELEDLMRGMPKWQTEWKNEKWNALF